MDSAATVKQTHPFLTHAFAKPCLVPPSLPSRLCLLRFFFNVGFNPSEFSSLLPVCSSWSHVQQTLPFSVENTSIYFCVEQRLQKPFH